MATMDEHGRPEPPVAADEVGTLLGYLDYQRATLAWKVAGLGADELRVSVAASSMTLGGLLKHMALVEDHWFSWTLFARERSAPWNAIDWTADRDWDWESAADDSPAELTTLWQQAVERSRADVAEALSDGGLDQCVRRHPDDREAMNLRSVLVHMIEEYARHNGHADLIREQIDGETGE